MSKHSQNHTAGELFCCFQCEFSIQIKALVFYLIYASFIIVSVFTPHLRWHLLTSLARSPSTLVSSTTVIKSSPIGWICCHGTSSRTKKRLVKKGINRPLAFWASQIWLWLRFCLLFSHKCPFVSQAFPSAGCSRVDKLLRVQCQCVRAVRRYATLCLGLHLSQRW